MCLNPFDGLFEAVEGVISQVYPASIPANGLVVLSLLSGCFRLLLLLKDSSDHRYALHSETTPKSERSGWVGV